MHHKCVTYSLTLTSTMHTLSVQRCLQGGLPILTCPGATMASRVVYSHLTSLELGELVANNLTHYVQLAVKIENHSLK